MRQFVRRLCHDLVTLREAVQMKTLYRPPRFKYAVRRRIPAARNSSPRQPQTDLPVLRVVYLEHTTLDKAERDAERKGKVTARKRLRNTRYFKVDCFLFQGRCRMKRLNTLIQVTDEGRRKKLVSPPAKIIHLEPVSKKREKETVVFLESPKKHRSINLNRLAAAIGPRAKELLGEDGVIRNQSFIGKLLAVWTGADK